jgi:hypothetical protein
MVGELDDRALWTSESLRRMRMREGEGDAGARSEERVDGNI